MQLYRRAWCACELVRKDDRALLDRTGCFYDDSGHLLVDAIPAKHPLYECSSFCACGESCGNSIAQVGIRCARSLDLAAAARAHGGAGHHYTFKELASSADSASLPLRRSTRAPSSASMPARSSLQPKPRQDGPQERSEACRTTSS